MANPGVYAAYGPAVAGQSYPPGPIAWPAGQSWPLRASGAVYANDLNSQLSLPVAFLSRKPYCCMTETSTVTFSSTENVNIPWDTEYSDAWGMHSDSSDTTQLIIPPTTDGLWLVQTTIPVKTTADTFTYAAEITHTPVSGSASTVSGTHVQSQASSDMATPGCIDLIACSAGDILQISGATTDTGGATTVPAGNSIPLPGMAAPWTAPVVTARWIAANNSLPGGVYPVTVPLRRNNAQGQQYQNAGTTTLAIPAPGTWTDGEVATAAQFNSDIRNSVLFLANVPVMRAAGMTGTPASIPSGTASVVTGMTATIDNWGAWNAANNEWVCPVAGAYLVIGAVQWPSQSSSFLSWAQFGVTDDQLLSTWTGPHMVGTNIGSTAARVLRFNAGDTLQLYGYQQSGSSIAPYFAGNETRLITIWLSE